MTNFQPWLIQTCFLSGGQVHVSSGNKMSFLRYFQPKNNLENNSQKFCGFMFATDPQMSFMAMVMMKQVHFLKLFLLTGKKL